MQELAVDRQAQIRHARSGVLWKMALAAAGTIAMIALVIAASSHASAKTRHHRHHHYARHIALDASGNSATIIGGRPAGCPHAYCGCGLRLYLGIADKRLDLAANWPRYYRGGRMIAVWRHHVALVERLNGDGTALLRDYNSGRGLSRLHVRSIRGAHIINRTQLARFL